MRRVASQSAAAPRARRRAVAGGASTKSIAPLPPDIDTAGAFKLIARGLLRLIAAQQAGVRRRDPASVHQMRIALRRLRAALTIFAELVDDRRTARFKRELKWVAGRLAPARDLHVMAVKLEGAEIGSAAPSYARRLAAKRAAAFDGAKAAVERQRFRSLLHDLRHWCDAGDWTKRAGEATSAKSFARHVLTHRAAKLVKKLRKLDDLDDGQRHRVRIAAKKLYYAIGFFDSLFTGHRSGRRLERFGKHLKKLLDALGALNDVAVRRALAHRLGKRRAERAATEALAELDEADIAEQTKAARKAATKLADDPLFGD